MGFGPRFVEYKVSCLWWDFTNKHLDEWTVYHRYSDFEKLHRALKPDPEELKLPQRKVMATLAVVTGQAYDEDHLVERSAGCC